MGRSALISAIPPSMVWPSASTSPPARLEMPILNAASGRHGVLCLNGLNQGLAIEVKSGELMRRKFNVNFLVLCTKKIDFRNIVDGEKPGAHTLHIIAEFPLCEAVRSECVYNAIGLAELV